MRAFETLVIVLLAAKTGLAVINFWRLARMESNMATKAELEAAVENLAGVISTEIGEVTAELERLNGLIADQDLQPTIDRLNALSSQVQGIVTPVVPEA